MEQKKVILDQDIAKFKDEAKPLEAQVIMIIATLKQMSMTFSSSLIHSCIHSLI